MFNKTQCRNAKTTITITRHVALLSVFFAFNSATCLFVVVVCDMFVYIWHSFISAMCLFKSVFGLTVYVYSCVCNSATCLFIMVVCYPAQHIRL